MWPADDRQIGCHAPLKPSLQTVNLFKQCLLLLLDLAKLFPEREVLRLHGVDFALLILWPGVLSRGALLYRLPEGRSREERHRRKRQCGQNRDECAG